jgi:hypothetical protein
LIGSPNAVGSANPEGNLRDKSPAINGAWLPGKVVECDPGCAMILTGGIGQHGARSERYIAIL